MKNSIVILFCIFALNAISQTNKLFSKKKEECIYLVNENNYNAIKLTVNFEEKLTDSIYLELENELIRKKGFYDFVYNETENILTIYYISLVKDEIVESILEKFKKKYFIIEKKTDGSF
ncbi:MAG: hypothetical protein HYR91_14980 [Flavobacteriia bacterium]|nr:hypothetical protein [Flavobacteriia bacterium]